jgi:hypothetical protein
MIRRSAVALLLAAGSLACGGSPAKDYCARKTSTWTVGLVSSSCAQISCDQAACRVAVAHCSTDDLSEANIVQDCIDALPACALDGGAYLSGTFGCAFFHGPGDTCYDALSTAGSDGGCAPFYGSTGP